MFSKLRGYEVVLISALGILAALSLITPHRLWVIPLHALMIALVVGLSRAGEASPWHHVRQFFPAAGCLPIAFVETEALVPWINPFKDRVYDAHLSAADRWLFGDVQAWVAAVPPWLADLTMAGYLSYYLLPVVIGLVTYRRPEAFRETVTMITIAFLGSYIGYFFVPALGPHVTQPGCRPPNLDGVFLSATAHSMFSSLQGERPDVFPSGHTIVSVSMLVLYFRHARKLFWIWLPLVILLINGAWIHRYHYVVDITAGLVLAPIFIGASLLLSRASARVDSIVPVPASPPSDRPAN